LIKEFPSAKLGQLKAKAAAKFILLDKVHTVSWSREVGNLQMHHSGEQIEVAGFSFHLYPVLPFL
jgi:hypothetical protein